ncbi:M14 family zinc carboxypeptidase [Euryarchaeota archaeon]|nr:M14 family zinc carboxypeptidase [Euryarchaeota archaeon]MDA8690217.1 M14 family zinc carboxypeptidase [Euryarchaeota archaeon]MDA8700453.1 M14 family zinc carboxypeptidase [Euryarchaeota archaeon]MDA9166224.1 M14 family zinc carboxypeptidase [Candidatus Poseidoniaceae archaeon]MDC3235954.1 M14 family zinc carboxypeptidase [Candidatus Poseidoniaceae archaeon]
MQNGKVLRTRPSFGVLIVLPLLLSLFAPIANANFAQEEPTGTTPGDIWSDDYNNMIFPWASANDRALQFKEYHSYDTMKDRMMRLAEDNPDIFQFHEGMNGGTNARGEEVTADAYEGWYYGHASPWLKITGDVQGGEYNPYVGDTGNYADRHDVMIVGNHHAREWMSYTVALMQMEVIAFSYDNIGYDNDGDGLIDEDPWGDADGDGILDDDGDCLALATSPTNYQDSNGDGTNCGPGDLGVDEDYSEQFITDLVNSREIYLIPMLNVDGNIYDRDVYMPGQCPNEDPWDCSAAGWRKNLRDNTVTGVTPIPDLDETVDEGCDGVDLNRNYQFEWGAPLGATGPLFPGACYAGQNNDVYNGPVDDTDNDGDGQFNEDHVDGKDDDADGLTDEDWWGGNTEPETKFIQDLTEMNDDTGDGSSEFKATITHHSFSELILYPWGHCTNCQSPDHEQLKYHGQQMADMTQYANLQSSDLYPTSGDFCDWHYGVHGSYCYTSEIGTAFHQQEEDIDHIAVRNLGTGFYIAEIADSPRERADLAIANISQQNYLRPGDKVEIPSEGDIPIDLCVSAQFPYSETKSKIEWRTVKPSRLQSDYGPREWATTPWQTVEVNMIEDESCSLPDGNGTVLRGMVPISETAIGKLHYKATLSTLSGSDLFQYPAEGAYYEIDLSYRAAYGSFLGSLFMFALTATFVWGGLAVCLRMMLSDGEEIDLAAPESTEIESSEAVLIAENA